MQWNLLFSDVLARIMGVIGLLAAVPVLARALSDGGSLSRDLTLNSNVTIGAFMVVIALLFLLPKPHDVTLRITRPWALRPAFMVLCLLWGGLVLGELASLVDVVRANGLGRELLTAVWFTIPVFLLFFALLVFPFGYGWRAYRDLHAHHAMQRQQRRARAAAESIIPGTTRMTNGMVLRKADLLDNLMLVPFVIAMIAAFYGFKVSTTVQTAQWDLWADENLLLGTLAVSAALFGPMFLINLIRGTPYSSKAIQYKWGRRILGAALLPPMGLFVYVAVAYDGAPAAWNLVNDPAPATLRYEVTDVSTGRRTRGCVTLVVADQQDRQMYVCNLPDTLRPGDVIEATGPLSAYGHTINQVRVSQ